MEQKKILEVMEEVGYYEKVSEEDLTKLYKECVGRVCMEFGTMDWDNIEHIAMWKTVLKEYITFESWRYWV